MLRRFGITPMRPWMAMPCGVPVFASDKSARIWVGDRREWDGEVLV